MSQSSDPAIIAGVKYNNLAAFEKHLSQAAPDHLADLYLVISKDDLERESALELVKQHLCTNGLVWKCFDGEVVTLEALFEELHTLSFFTKSKVVLLRRADQLSKSDLKRLEEHFTQLNRTSKLVMTASELTSNMTFYKKAELAGVLLDVPVKKGAARETDLIDWVERRCAKAGKRIDRRASQALVKQIGDTSLLPQELEKLYCYVGERPDIGPQDVAAVCTVNASDTVWQLGDAIFRLDAASALQVGRSLLDQGNAFLSLVGQIRYQLQTGYQVCSLLDSGAPPSEITRHIPYLVGGLLDKQCRVSRQYGCERYKRGLQLLAATETQAKDSGAEPDFLLERLLIQLTG